MAIQTITTGLLSKVALGVALATVPGAMKPFEAQAMLIAAADSVDSVSATTDFQQGFQQGIEAFQSGRFSQALTQWQHTQPQELSTPQAAARLSYMALAEQELGDWKQAQANIAAALTLVQDLQTPEALTTQAMILNHQGQIQFAIGQPEDALHTWETAEKHYQHLQDAQGQMGSQINQVQALQALGLFRQAQERLGQVHQELATQTDSELKVLGLDHLGNVLQITGDIKQSQQVLEQSLAIATQLDDPINPSATYLSLGNTHRTLGQTQPALESYQKAAQTAPHALAKLKAQVNQLSLLIETQQWDVAQTLLTEISPESLPASRAAIYAQVNLAANAIKLSAQPDIAAPLATPLIIAERLRSTLIQARNLKDSRAESYVLGQLGELYEQTRQWDYAEEVTKQALQLAQDTNAPDIAYRWHWQLGRIYQHKAQRDTLQAAQSLVPSQHPYREAAIASYQESVKLLQAIRSDLLATNRDAQFSFQESVEPVYRELVSLLIRHDSSHAELEEARQVIESLQVAELENFFRSACLDNQTQKIDQVDRTATIVYPIILPDRLEVIVAIPDQPLQHYTTDLDQTEIEDTLTQTLTSLHPRFPNQERLQLSKTVYDWLIKPGEAAIAQSNTQTLVFVLDGMFRNLPMAALHDGEQYLLENYNIALTPGLQLLGPIQSLAPDQLTAVVAGISEPRQGFSALPGVESEVAQIAPQTKAKVVLNQAFTQEKLQQRINRRPSPIVHLATHGQFSSLPEETFLLSWDQKINVREFQSLLQSRDVTSRQPIELLVLSACQTASGDRRAALGLAGLAIRSGARSTLATLWSVQDDSTALLMSDFYNTLTQQPNLKKSEVLRQAQLKLIQNSKFDHPYYWAPFVLIGNWL